MTHVKAITHQLHVYRKGIFWLAALGVAFFALLYVYLINTTVLNVVARQRYTNQIAELTTSVSKLESENTSLKGSITIDEAKLLGFEESEQVTFVSRPGRDLSYNTR
jgi:hypothetical protein